MRIASVDDLTVLPDKIFFSTALLPQVFSPANDDVCSFVCITVAPNKLGDINQKYGRQGGDYAGRRIAEGGN